MFSFLPALVGFGSSSSSPFFSSFLLFAALALALLPQAAARFASINFSTVKQCGSFTVDFVGGKPPSALPLTLSVLPVNGTPIFIPLPLDAWNSTSQTGAAITFLPFPEGTQFIASLDDANGRGTALVSDVLVIDPSDNGDTSCLPTNPTPFMPRYAVNGSLSQCEFFSVNYDPTQPDVDSPTIRAFIPRGPSFRVNETEANGTAGVDTYLMNVPRGLTTVLLFSDKKGYHETSTLLPVFGNINSNTSCFANNPQSTATTLGTSNGSQKNVTPKIAIIVIAACVGVIVVVAVVMITWYFLHRRKAKQARKFTKLDEARSPTSPLDVEKQQPQILASSSTAGSPLSPADSGYGAFQQYVTTPPYVTMGSSSGTPTSPDPKDPFGERATGTILGSLSARESFNNKLGATALGNTTHGSSTLALPFPRARNISDAARSQQLASRTSELDPDSEKIPGTSPYWGGRLAVTPDNSLATNADSVLHRNPSLGVGAHRSFSSASVSSVEIDHILEMATIYGSTDIPELPRPAVTAPATLRSSAYMAGRESRRTSMAVSQGSSPVHSRNNSNAATTTAAAASASMLSHSNLRLARAFREPPLATLPSSPLPSPGVGARPSFDLEGLVAASQQPAGAMMNTRPLAVPQSALLTRNVSATTRGSVYSEDGEEDLDGFTILQPPTRRS